MNISEIRKKYPQYSDLSDQQVADGLHKKFYSDIPINEFYGKIGLTQAQPINNQAVQPLEQATPGAPSGFVKGLRDPIDAMAQMAANAVPESLAQNVNALNNWLADKGLPLERIPEGGLNQQLAEQEAAYQAQRGGGFDYGRLAGNILNPVNLAAASKIPQAAGLLKSAAIAAPAGAAFGMLQPVTQGDFAEEKTKQALLGGLLGPASTVTMGAASKLISPNVRQAVTGLMSKGVTPTPGQIMGGALNRAEEKMMSLPLLGDAIKAGRTRAIGQMNKAALDRVLEPLGKKLPDTVKIGQEGLAYVKRQASQAYDDVLSQTKGVMDDALSNDLQTIKLMSSRGLPKQHAKILTNKIEDFVEQRFTKDGLASGSTLQQIQNKLRTDAAPMLKSQDPFQRDIGNALMDVRKSITNMVVRNNPGKADELQRANQAWANYSVLREASKTRGTAVNEGILSPGQLNAGVYKQDPSFSKTRFQAGNATMQDISDPGMQVLSTQFPNSGTFDRAIMGVGAAGGLAALDPSMLALAGIASLPYAPGVQRGVANLLTRGPTMLPNKFTKPVANAIRKASPYLIPGAASIPGLLGNNPK